MLFNKRLLQTHLNNFEYPQSFDFSRAEKIIGNWQTALRNGNYDDTKETRVQASFLNLFFNIILGYSEMNDNPAEWHLINEAKTEFDATQADGALGYFTKDEKTNITRAVIELKDAKTPLDKKQSTRKDYDSPVSQAFSYLSKIPYCDWAIVSNFKEIRLYHKDKGQGYYESFEILNLNNEKEFKRFYFLLCKQNLLDKDRNSLLDKLVKDTTKNEEEISKQFYKDFKALRLDLFNHIKEHNAEITSKILLEKTQKLLDRMVFIFFCEDTNNLLPNGIVRQVYELGIKSRERSDQRIWREFKNLFIDIDEGRHDITPPINAYNGGLFKTDDILENLNIKDDIWEKIVKMSDYDFESDLNVNILGHIFEQSLSDLEQIKAELDGIEEDKSKSKRKKDGIFYTPEYITRYIVEQTVGKYLEENPDKLATIKILDPACGSGAFLNQAHSFLKQEYQNRYEEKINEEHGFKKENNAKIEFRNLDLREHINIAETDRSILLNNLFGVDLNEESTEITKLSLWLKTARKDQQLQNLDDNIKCGNSLIADPAIAGEKAFNWNNEFNEIMQQGGFDCIIGNPPYLRLQGLKENLKKETLFFENKYKSATGRYDIYVLFIEQAFKLLKPNGKLCFILPNKFINSDFGKGIRKFIYDNKALESIISFGSEMVFQEASTYTCILTLSKNSNETFKAVQIKPAELINVQSQTFDYHTLNQDKWNFSSGENQLIINKITNNKLSIDDVFKGVFQGVVTGDNKAFCLSNCIIKSDYVEGYSDILERNILIEKNIVKQLLKAQDINRYSLSYSFNGLIYPYIDNQLIEEFDLKNNYPKCYEYLLSIKQRLESRGSANMHYPAWYALWNSRKIENQEISKIITPDVCYGTSMAFDVNGTYFYNDTAYAFIKNPDCNLDYKFLISILNSKIIWFFLKNTGTTLRGGYFRFKTSYLKGFTFPLATQEQQTSLANKAEQMIELNKQLFDGVKSALELLTEQYQPKKISQKLESFYSLGFHPFIEELEKQCVKLSLSQKEELMNWYNPKAQTLNSIKNQIDTLDRAIDNEVYKLYNLTEEEIKIIEEG